MICGEVSVPAEHERIIGPVLIGVDDAPASNLLYGPSEKNLGFIFRKTLEGLLIDSLEQDEEITAKFMNEDQFRDEVSQNLLKEAYEKIREEAEDAGRRREQQGPRRLEQSNA